MSSRRRNNYETVARREDASDKGASASNRASSHGHHAGLQGELASRWLQDHASSTWRPSSATATRMPNSTKRHDIMGHRLLRDVEAWNRRRCQVQAMWAGAVIGQSQQDEK